eukprot:443745_1
MKHFGYATTGDGKYVIISGGTYYIPTSIDSNNENKIFVFDIDNTQILESKILCPQCSLFHSIIMPESIITFVCKWYSNDYLYLLKDEQHWKISVNKVIQRSFPIDINTL